MEVRSHGMRASPKSTETVPVRDRKGHTETKSHVMVEAETGMM